MTRPPKSSTSTTDLIRVESEGAVRLVLFDRPPANVLDRNMYLAIERVFAQLATDESARAVVIASALPGIFMAGADLKEFPERDNSKVALREHLERIHSAFDRVAKAPMPVIVAIEGHALGGGCELALCCDFRFMARGTARIGLPEISLGLMPGGGGTQRLARLIGRQAASRLAFLGERLDADAAQAVGLVWAVSEGQALPAARELASSLAEQAPGALRRIKRAISEGLTGTLEDGLALEQELAIETSGGSEALEGVCAFLEKRSPAWKTNSR